MWSPAVALLLACALAAASAGQHHHKKHKDKPPAPGLQPAQGVDAYAANASHVIPPKALHLVDFGLLIDAGSTGSRLHVYEWQPRVFSTLPPPISHPLTSELWTKRRKPGLSSYPDDPQKAAATLLPLLEHAKSLLRHYEPHWHRYPIWVKATAGMRSLAHTPRRAIVDAMRDLLRSDQNPFYFVEADAARVISGEEEAAYAWAGINFALGHLLEDGTGAGTARPTRAVGTIEMGGASTQIAFINPGHDFIENLFKVQVGGLKHWNVYARSFLHYGAYSVQQRMWNELAAHQGCFDAAARGGAPCVVRDACLPLGAPGAPATESVTGESGVIPPGKFGPLVPATIVPAPPTNGTSRFQACLAQLTARKSTIGLQGNISDPRGYMEGPTHRRFNEWCDWAHHGQCAFTDVYLPLLPYPEENFGEFRLLGSSLVDTFRRLGVPKRTNLFNLSAAAGAFCELGYADAVAHGAARDSADKTGLPFWRAPHNHTNQSAAEDFDDVGKLDANADDDDAAEDDDSAAAGGAKRPPGVKCETNTSIAAMDPDERRAYEEAFQHAEEQWETQLTREVCFKAALAVSMLNHGFGVDMDRELLATDIIRTRQGKQLKAGWTLGAILFEINSLPWVYDKKAAKQGAGPPKEPPVPLPPEQPSAAAAAELAAELSPALLFSPQQRIIFVDGGGGGGADGGGGGADGGGGGEDEPGEDAAAGADDEELDAAADADADAAADAAAEAEDGWTDVSPIVGSVSPPASGIGLDTGAEGALGADEDEGADEADGAPGPQGAIDDALADDLTDLDGDAGVPSPHRASAALAAERERERAALYSGVRMVLVGTAVAVLLAAVANISRLRGSPVEAAAEVEAGGLRPARDDKEAALLGGAERDDDEPRAAGAR